MKQFSSDFRNHLCNSFTYTLELAETSRATLSSNQDECLAIIYFPVLSAGYAYSHCVVIVFVFVFFFAAFAAISSTVRKVKYIY